MAHDVFVSHSAKDKTVSDALVARLEAEGIRCWVAPRDVVPGADWGESIIDAIESSRIMVLIFSASANGSPQIRPSPAPAAPQRQGKTNWTLIIVGIVALLLIAGVAITGGVLYLIRVAPASSHVSSSPAPARLSPPSQLTAPPSAPKEAKLK